MNVHAPPAIEAFWRDAPLDARLALLQGTYCAGRGMWMGVRRRPVSAMGFWLLGLSLLPSGLLRRRVPDPVALAAVLTALGGASTQLWRAGRWRLRPSGVAELGLELLFIHAWWFRRWLPRFLQSQRLCLDA